ncbi:MAG: two-component system cell cycle response regulator [Gammaproteobacteria bacterium]|jgi:two-component system cell cycle response regulator
MKLLIAEDDLTSRTMLKAVTRRWDYEPITVDDGEAAWQLLQGDDTPRLLLVDWEMPNLNGLALCQRIRAKEEGTDPVYIILLTARNSTDDIVAGLEAGANDYIAKPFDNAELHARLQVGSRMLKLQEDLNNTKQALAFQATHDSLTGLLNRGAVMEAMGLEIDRTKRQPLPLYIGLCDIDHFKLVNDTHGHLAGDEVLRHVAERLSATLRPYDRIGRYGGEEFLILLNTDKTNAHTLFERIRKAVADEPFVYEQTSLQLTISCGVSFFEPSQSELNEKELLAIADAALYRAKAAGRNQVVFDLKIESKI